MPDPFFNRHEKLEPRFGPSPSSQTLGATLGGAQNVAMDALADGCRFEDLGMPCFQRNP